MNLFLLLISLLLPALSRPLSLTIHGATGHLGRRIIHQLLSSPSSPHYSTINGVASSNQSISKLISLLPVWFPSANVNSATTITINKTTLSFTLSSAPPPPSTDTIVCVPPSKLPPTRLAEICATHKSSNVRKKHSQGRIVYVSSTGVYPDSTPNPISASTPISIPSLSPRNKKLHDLEILLPPSSTSILRFAGLYHLTRGAHTHWLNSSPVPIAGSSDSLVHQIHYTDAATATVLALSSENSVELLWACCTTRGDIMKAAVAVDSLYKRTVDPRAMSMPFESSGVAPEEKGRVLAPSSIKLSLKYPSFTAFMAGPDEETQFDVDGAPRRSRDVLEGVKLVTIVTVLAQSPGWEKLAAVTSARCMHPDNNPMVKSTLKFLRSREGKWAREKVEELYRASLERQ